LLSWLVSRTMCSKIAALSLHVATSSRHAVEHAAEGQPTDFRRDTGAPFEGKFENSRRHQVRSKNLVTSRFGVKFDKTSVNTRDNERDGTLQGARSFLGEAVSHRAIRR
jgi:hypothetical protein